MDFVETHFENIYEYTDLEIFSIIKDGVQNPVAKMPCYECSEEYICVDENI